MRNSEIYSIGYEGLKPGEFISILLNLDISVLVDVRELPLSRRQGFSKTALSTSLEKAGIQYKHFRAAGNPFRKLAVDRETCLAQYRKHIVEQEKLFTLLSSEIRATRSAFLCFERSHTACHRSVLISELMKRGLNAKLKIVE